MNGATKDWIEVFTWAVGVVGALAGLLNLARETRQSRRQRSDELRWRKASGANDMLNSFYADPVFRNAMLMLDWDGRPFQMDENRTITITREDIWAALARPPAPFDDKNLFIRTAMDRMFEAFDRIGHAIKIEVMADRDITYALVYYVGVLAQNRDVVQKYMLDLGFKEALTYFRKHQEWERLGQG
ncbi:MAG TPA: hypothetical protein VFV99_02545, partial [Kofleriaceae bacterium]|nr:hypothetical protein [Kofleriaceae bacterium]